VSIGAAFTSPDLDNDASQVVTQIQGQAVQSSSGSGGPSDPNLAARTVILAGNPDTVAQALALARQLDVKRRQVKIDLRITDISVDAEHDLGLQWNFGSESLTENHTSGLGLGSFTRSPLDVDATISAMESQDLAHLLAAPTLTLLDGEHSYILIGQKLLYPVVVGYTQSNTPIFDKAEEDVGIYMQVAADIDDDNEITLTIYPQVSEISGYLNVNGASYPQISTREQQTTVRVRDGEQIVIGGLLQDDDINNLQRVPGLSKIPFFGQLFNSRSRSKTRDEVVVIITPQIIQD
jgi:general secretion pathway protein D